MQIVILFFNFRTKWITKKLNCCFHVVRVQKPGLKFLFKLPNLIRNVTEISILKLFIYDHASFEVGGIIFLNVVFKNRKFFSESINIAHKLYSILLFVSKFQVEII
jgi:hypothetical protein